MKVPTAMPPDQIGAMVDRLLGDLPELDPNHALSVTPSGFDPGVASTQYCIRYWVSDYRGLASIESRIQARLVRTAACGSLCAARGARVQ